MKLATYQYEDNVSYGLVTDRGLVDIPAAWKGGTAPATLLDLLGQNPSVLESLPDRLNAQSEPLPLESVTILAPLPRPGKVLALAGNYAKHIEEASLQRGFKLGLSDSPRWTTTPRPFLMPSTVIRGPGETISWPAYSQEIDYELELAVIIGRPAKSITADDAMDCVAGYTIANDISARSVTFKEERGPRPWDDFYDWLNGKWADGFCPTGPYLVTRDEIPDVQDLKMTLKVNDQVRQDASTAQMIYTVADIVSFLSHLMTLEPGDLISTGTPSGVGMADGRFLQAGDTIECAIENLGTLTNTLGPRPEPFYTPLKSNATGSG